MCFMFFCQCCFVYISNDVIDFLLANDWWRHYSGRSLILRFLPGPVVTGPVVMASQRSLNITVTRGHQTSLPKSNMVLWWNQTVSLLPMLCSPNVRPPTRGIHTIRTKNSLSMRSVCKKLHHIRNNEIAFMHDTQT